MPAKTDRTPVALEPGPELWEQCFISAPLVVVGTREPDGRADMAPKHMVTALSWEDHFGFVCTPAHATYRNIERDGCFTDSFPRPDQVVLASLAAAPRCEDQKAALEAIPTVPARTIEGVVLADARLYFECALDRIVDGLGPNSLVAGRIVEAYAGRQRQRTGRRRPGPDRSCPVARLPESRPIHQRRPEQRVPVPRGDVEMTAGGVRLVGAFGARGRQRGGGVQRDAIERVTGVSG